MKNHTTLAALAVSLALAQSVQARGADALLVDAAAFRKDVGGAKTDLYTLRNKSGMAAQVTNYGAKLVTLIVPNRNGVSADVVMGYDNIDRYLTANPNFGATVGRYANRIANASFALDGKTYALTKNDGPNTLHGGNAKSFRSVVWTAGRQSPNSLTLTYLSKDGDEGFPGNLKVSVTYTLTDANEMKIEYRATTDKPTVVNLTNHSFFHLGGHGNGDVLKQLLEINAATYTRAKEGFVPTGEFVKVDGTPMDFRQPRPVGLRINKDYPELKLGKPGYDQNFVLDKKPGELGFAARVVDLPSGRVMELHTTEPGLQFFSGQNSNGQGGFVGKGNTPYNMYSSICLEPQHFPDSPNRPEFPSTVLRPGQTYKQLSVYKFSVIKD